MASVTDKLIAGLSGRAEMAKGDLRDNLFWGKVVNVDAENLLMDVHVIGGGANKVVGSIPINSDFTSDGYGLRLIPSTSSVVILNRVNDKLYTHIGYHYGSISQLISNTSNTKDNEVAIILKRSIESGEVQMVGLTNNEIYLSNDGSVLLKAQFGASLALDNIMHRLEGNFANMRYEMDGVRIRAGNIIRPVVASTNEDDFIVLNESNVVVKESTLAENKNGSPLREFEVKVGTTLSSEGVDNDPPLSPTIGTLTIGDRIVNEKGEEITVLGNSVNFRLKMSTGCSLVVDNTGSFYILDDTSGSFTKFGVGPSAEKSLRSGDSMILINEEQGVYLKHASGSTLQMDKDGKIQFSDKSNNSILMQDTGITINSPDGDVNIIAKKIILSPASSIYLGDPLSALDTLLSAGRFAQVFDVHKHLGPVGVVNPADGLMNAANADKSSAPGIKVP